MFRIYSAIRLDPDIIKLFSHSTQLSMKFFLLINVKMQTIVGILTFTSMQNSISGLFDPKKADFLIFLYLKASKISCSTQLSMKSFITSGLGFFPSKATTYEMHLRLLQGLAGAK